MELSVPPALQTRGEHAGALGWGAGHARIMAASFSIASHGRWLGPPSGRPFTGSKVVCQSCSFRVMRSAEASPLAIARASAASYKLPTRHGEGSPRVRRVALLKRGDRAQVEGGGSMPPAGDGQGKAAGTFHPF